MAHFNSKFGIMTPAKERAVNPNAPRGKEINEGPDRDALRILKEQGVEHLGQDFRNDPEMKMRAKQMGYDTIEEYVNDRGFDRKAQEERFKQRDHKIVDHKQPERKGSLKIDGGAVDTTGSGARKSGGFGDHTQELNKA